MNSRRRFLRLAVSASLVAAAVYSGCGSADDTSFGAAPDGGGAGGQSPDVTGGCSSDPDCSTGEHCVGSRCVADQPCKSSLDCTERPDGETVCDRGTGQCVQCIAVPDCEANHDCINGRCVPFSACKNSLDCPSGQVCDAARGRCVECVQAADCGMNRVCAGDKCRDRCDSDKDCTPLGLLCDTAGGHCVECLDSSLCRDDQYCQSGVCVPDVCTAGQKSCQNDAILTCSEAGDGYGSPVPCGAGQTCDPSANGIVCHGADAGAGGTGGVGGAGTGGTTGVGGTAGGPTDASTDTTCGAISTCGNCLCDRCLNEWLACESDPANTATAGCRPIWQCVDQTGCRGAGCLFLDGGVGTSPCQPLIGASSSDSLNRERALPACVDNAGCPCNRGGGTGGVGGASGSGGTSGRGGTSGTGGTGGTCNVASCTNSCLPVTQERCCKSDGSCGCRTIIPASTTCS